MCALCEHEVDPMSSSIGARWTAARRRFATRLLGFPALPAMCRVPVTTASEWGGEFCGCTDGVHGS